MAPSSRLDDVINLCKRRGFVFPSGEIYGGTRSAWDYGPLGVELKENIKKQWWRNVVTAREDVVGLDSSVILPTPVWQASGHLSAFVDPLIECLSCHRRFRQDHLQEEYAERKRLPDPDAVAMTDIPCPHCGTRGQWTEPRMFNGLLKTYLGVTQDESGLHYLRPETAQGIFVNFSNVVNATRKRPPFGIGQVGKSFRNEITPGNFIFRTLEFEQMEMEFFVPPEQAADWYAHWKQARMDWYVELGIRPDHLRLRDHDPDELSHYSSGTADVEYLFPMGWSELEGIANRGDFDLSAHAAASGKDLEVVEPDGRRYVPHVIEPAAGVGRSLLAFLADAYDEEAVEGESRTVLKLHPRLSPVKVAVLPLVRKDGQPELAAEVHAALKRRMQAEYDEGGSIGKRYRRQDEIGTPWCVTIDHETLQDHTVTVRDRDTLAQERVAIDALPELL
ncbi:MAG TPA: glycine--tRNA ligase, partial [Propionibacteriaceae bacterium]|nr:glycine--tRNA ligase [Propionibacteriaceae bacterium]